MKKLLKRTLRSVGLDVGRYRPQRSDEIAGIQDLSVEEKRIVSSVLPFTATSVERIVTLMNAVNHICANGIGGDIAECGVWRGGSMMTVALTLLARRDTSRSLYLYDTFEGMTAPTENDRSFDGVTAEQQLRATPPGTGVWCYASLEEVRANLLSTGYPVDKLHFVKGAVEKTIPQVRPNHLALLRLDTDWYESTKHELTHLFPVLDKHGILIVDDYGHWEGARKAVDEYFREQKISDYFHRIDCTGRILVRTGS